MSIISVIAGLTRHPGFFHKTIQVYCNVENEIISLTIKGMVEQ